MKRNIFVILLALIAVGCTPHAEEPEPESDKEPLSSVIETVEEEVDRSWSSDSASQEEDKDE